jgi:hypothetical protein
MSPESFAAIGGGGDRCLHLTPSSACAWPATTSSVTLQGTSYAVTYFKRRGSAGPFAKDIVHKDDPRIPMTSAEFLAGAWNLANDKARELGWIV